MSDVRWGRGLVRAWIVAAVVGLLSAPAMADQPTTRRDLLDTMFKTNNPTIGTLGTLIAIREKATDLGLDGAKAMNALKPFCTNHPNVALISILDLLTELKAAVKPTTEN